MDSAWREAKYFDVIQSFSFLRMSDDDIEEIDPDSIDQPEDSDEEKETRPSTGTAVFPRFVSVGGQAIEDSTLKSYERYQKRFKVCTMHHIYLVLLDFS